MQSACDAGLLTSVGPLGTATITAASGDLTAEIEAEVVPPPSSLVVSPASLRLAVGESIQLSIVVTDENGDSIPDAEIVLHTDNAAVASVACTASWRAGGPAWPRSSSPAARTAATSR